MRKDFQKLIQNYNELKFVLDDIVAALPLSPKNFKLRTKLESAYREVKKSFDKLDPQITNNVPGIRIDKKPYTKEFLETWEIYELYLTEQHGIRMGTRMKKYRLLLLMELTAKDLKKAASWLEYYMASGSASIYIVNQINTPENDRTTKEVPKKASFSIPV